MKKCEYALAGIVFFFVLDVLGEILKYYMITDRWYFGVAGLFSLFLGWVGVFSGLKYLQQKNKKTARKTLFYKWVIWLVYIATLFMTFDIMRYLVENSVLNKYYFLILGFVCLFLGWFSSRLDMKCFNKQNKFIFPGVN